MARQLEAPLPSSVGDLALTFLGSLPTSAVFSLEKLGAALHWPLSTPYTIPMAGLDGLFALVVTAITVVGIVALVRRLVIGRHAVSFESSYVSMALGAIVVGTSLTLVSSATESRFALPMVLVGVLGLTTIADVSPRRMWARGRWWVIGGFVATVAVVLVGYAGLSSPMPAGNFDQATCALL